MIHLSLLIPTTPDRTELLFRLFRSIDKAAGLPITADDGSRYLGTYKDFEFEVLLDIDDGLMSIGEKRNRLMQRAKGEYLAFIDSDDMVTHSYFKHNFEGIQKGVDACSLRGIIYERNSPPRYFEHSIKYKSWETIKPDPTGFADQFYVRNTNHLNCTKSALAKQIEFPYFSRGEDAHWSNKLLESGLIKTEHYIEDVLYIYEPSDTRK